MEEEDTEDAELALDEALELEEEELAARAVPDAPFEVVTVPLVVFLIQ